MLTFLLLLGRSSSLVLLDAAGAVRANRGAVDAGVLLLGLLLVHVVALMMKKKTSDGRKKTTEKVCWNDDEEELYTH